MVLADPCDDQEMITDEEKSVFRRIGLRLKSYLPLGNFLNNYLLTCSTVSIDCSFSLCISGVRGVFDGVIENMHLHWKHREVVKLISKQKTLSFVEETARLLAYESGGILVAIERVPKGYALIFYRGKNYRRPINIRPRNLLTKAKALKRAVAMQRHEVSLPYESRVFLLKILLSNSRIFLISFKLIIYYAGP
jgi:RNA-binding protein YhbY